MITLSQAKSYLGFSISDYDNLLSEIISYSIGYVESYLGFSLEEETKTNMYQGTGRQFLHISKPILKEINEVKINGEILDNSKYSVMCNMLFRKDDIWEKEYLDINLVKYNIEVTYKSGFVYPIITDIINTSDVPKEIQYVVLELVKRIFIKAGVQQQVIQESGTMKSASMNNSYYEIKFTEDIPKDIRRILDKYRA